MRSSPIGEQTALNTHYQQTVCKVARRTNCSEYPLLVDCKMYHSKLLSFWEPLCWLLLILINRSQYPVRELLIQDQCLISLSQLNPEYRLKIKLICRLKKDRDQAFILISTIQEFPAQNILYYEDKVVFLYYSLFHHLSV